MRPVPEGMRIAVAQIEVEAIIDLYEVDFTFLGGDILRFHAGMNGLREPVVWQGYTYQPYPVSVTGFEMKANGTSSRPKMVFANLTGLITGINHSFNDALGAIVTRREVMESSLDEVNFVDGNPQADPTNETVSRWIIEQMNEHQKEFVSYTLALPSETDGALIPARVILADVCPWRYRSANCSYNGGPVADEKDHPITDPNKDRCGKRLSSCRLRFPPPNWLPFGGFPGANKVG
ncbi:phage minor tail protein L [Yersinia frederiksenii]|nr:phage minor tail protein L [Yersinia frederiksenii]